MRIRVVDWLEIGRRPALLPALASAGLAAFTGIRFLILLQALTPTQYGEYNLFGLMAAVLPTVMFAGLALQFQRRSHEAGRSVVRPLLRVGTLTIAVSVAPTAVIIFCLCAPLEGWPQLLLVVLFLLVITASIAATTMHSQIMLGLNYRSTAAIMLFLTNSAGTAAFLPAFFSTGLNPISLLGWWAALAVLCAVATDIFIRPFRSSDSTQIPSGLSMAEGILSIPGQAGAVITAVAVRYLLAINVSASAVANFAVAATVADMSYLIAITAVAFFTNRILAGDSPARGIRIASGLHVVLCIVGGIAVIWILPLIGGPGYVLSVSVMAILVVVGLVRIYTTAWTSRALGMKQLHVLSIAYAIGVGVAVLGLWFFAPTDANTYALVTLGVFTVVAVAQRIAVRSRGTVPKALPGP